jgi:hypothetical protein
MRLHLDDKNGMLRWLLKSKSRFFQSLCLAFVIALQLGTLSAQSEATPKADEQLQQQIKSDLQRYQELYERGELEGLATLMTTNVANPQFSPAERKAYALRVASWLRSNIYSTYLTVKRQQKEGESFPVARLRQLFDHYDVVYQSLEELAPNDLEVLNLQLSKEEAYLRSYLSAQATDQLKGCQERILSRGGRILEHPRARWSDHCEVIGALEAAELFAKSDELLGSLIAQADGLGVRSAANWSRLGWKIQMISTRDLFRSSAMDCYETALALAAQKTPADFKLQHDVAERLVLLLQTYLKRHLASKNEAPPEAFTRDLARAQTAVSKLQRLYPENTSQARSIDQLRKELHYTLATVSADTIEYARLTRNQMGDVIGFLLSLKQSAPSDQAAKFDVLIADVQMRRVYGLTKSTEASWRNDDEAETRYKLACAGASESRLSDYKSIYNDYRAHAEKLKEVEAKKRQERLRAEPAVNEWVADFKYQDPRLIDQPIPTAAPTPAPGGANQTSAPAQSTSRYCMTCSGTGSRTVWEDAYDSYSRKWGRQQVRKSCDRCGGKGTLP